MEHHTYLREKVLDEENIDQLYAPTPNQYDVIFDDDFDEFKITVNDALKEGWILISGISTNDGFYQAVQYKGIPEDTSTEEDLLKLLIGEMATNENPIT